MQLGCFGFHRQIYPQEGDSKKKWKIEIFGKFDMPTASKHNSKPIHPPKISCLKSKFQASEIELISSNYYY